MLPRNLTHGSSALVSALLPEATASHGQYLFFTLPALAIHAAAHGYQRSAGAWSSTLRWPGCTAIAMSSLLLAVHRQRRLWGKSRRFRQQESVCHTCLQSSLIPRVEHIEKVTHGETSVTRVTCSSPHRIIPPTSTQVTEVTEVGNNVHQATDACKGHQTYSTICAAGPLHPLEPGAPSSGEGAARV